jgi:hypothetical protein
MTHAGTWPESESTQRRIFLESAPNLLGICAESTWNQRRPQIGNRGPQSAIPALAYRSGATAICPYSRSRL